MVAGAQAKAGLETSIKRELAPSIAVYDELAQKAGQIPLDDTKGLADTLRSKRYAKYKTGDVKTMVNNIADDLENITTLEELRDLKTIVGAEAGVAQGAKRKTLGEISGDLADLEQKILSKKFTGETAEMAAGGVKATTPIAQLDDSSKVSIEYLTKRFRDDPQIANKIQSAQRPGEGPYLPEPLQPGFPTTPNFASEPMGVIGQKGISQPHYGPRS